MIFHQQNNSQGNYNYNLRIYKDIKYAAHFHKNYEFIYQIIGTTKLYVHNRQFEISKGQGALVLSNQKLEPNSVYAGVPAKKVKEVTPEQRETIIQRIANDYRLYASWYEEK